MSYQPLILITNDDGIASKGILAAAEARASLGEVLICAPLSQQSGTGRSMPPTSEGRIFPRELGVGKRQPARLPTRCDARLPSGAGCRSNHG